MGTTTKLTIHIRRAWQRSGRLTFGSLMAALLLTVMAQPAACFQLDGKSADVTVPTLGPTAHPELPTELSHFWLAPRQIGPQGEPAGPAETLARAIKLEGTSQFSAALTLLRSKALQGTPLAGYAAYYSGQAELGLQHVDRARQIFAALVASQPEGFLSEAAPLAQARAAEQLNDYAGAVAIYQQLLAQNPTAPADVLSRLGRAAAAAGDAATAAKAWRRVYYEFPLSDQADAAKQSLDALSGAPALPDEARETREQTRAGLLFQSGHFREAREAYAALLSDAPAADRPRFGVRLAAAELQLGRYRQARDAAKPYVSDGPLQAEASYDYAAALRGLGQDDDYIRAVHQMRARFGSNPWVEAALDDLGSYYIINDQDDEATATFSDLLARFPDGAHAERAAWKVGWAAYRTGDFDGAIKTFDEAAARYPRSNYRPAYLYWAGRSYEQLKNQPLADARFALVATDYLNSYYGRRAVQHLGGEDAWRKVASTSTPAGQAVVAAASDPAADLPKVLPPTGETVRLLLSAGLDDQAMGELRYAQRVWGNSPVIEATIGWIDNRQGDLRSGINAMKAAYPQYLAAAGDRLPTPILKVLFPLDYWPLIKKYSAAHHLDPYLMAALIAQESTFEPAVRSSANAIGLMQLLPSTGRAYARHLHYRRFSTRMLTNATTNIRLGMAFFADLVDRLGGVHYALASYNAGASRVSQWIEERKGLGLDEDEFIEDIPFPETQNYVKKILGTAADYRRLYGGEAVADGAPDAGAPKAAPAKKAGTSAKAKTRAKKKPVKKTGIG